MNIDLDKYTRNFRIFYSKIIGTHPDKQILQKKFKFLLQNQGNKWRSGLFNNKQTQFKSVKNILNRTKFNKNNNDSEKQIKNKQECLMQTIDFTRAFLFAYIYYLLQIKSKQGIKKIKQALDQLNVFVQGKFFVGLQLRKINVGWLRIQKIFNNIFNVKPYIAIADTINDFSIEFIDLMYKAIVKDQVQKVKNGQINQQKFNYLSKITKINIDYFQLYNNQTKIIGTYGQNRKSVSIGYIKQDQIYIVVNQVQDKNKKKYNIQQQKTIKKLTQISLDLFKMYQQTNSKLNNLDSILLAKQNAYKAAGNQIKVTTKPSRLKRANSIKSQRYY